MKININMESDCCGASEWIEDTGICGACFEHADWNDEDEIEDLRDTNGEN